MLKVMDKTFGTILMILFVDLIIFWD